jgi:hypothetical protein
MGKKSKGKGTPSISDKNKAWTMVFTDTPCSYEELAVKDSAVVKDLLINTLVFEQEHSISFYGETILTRESVKSLAERLLKWCETGVMESGTIRITGVFEKVEIK